MNTETKNIKAILVDDEPKAITNLSYLLKKHCPKINIIATINSVDEAVIEINKHKPDVVFLDIEMPEKSGFDLFDEITEKFQTIFVTAYDEFALKAFEVSAIDYLLKPIEIKRLQLAVEKLNTKSFNHTKIESLKQTITSSEISQIIVPFKDTQLIVKVQDIICIKANQSYSIIYYKDDNTTKNITYSKPLVFFCDLLEGNSPFYRIHRSWLINTKEIIQMNKREKTAILSGDIEVQISRSKQKEFFDFLNTK